jgi:hypothetical protein
VSILRRYGNKKSPLPHGERIKVRGKTFSTYPHPYKGREDIINCFQESCKEKH